MAYLNDESALGLDWALKRVAAFQVQAGQPAPSTPRPISSDRASVRAAWMREELEEFVHAKTVVDQSDAIIDLVYFALGTLVEMGVPAEPLFDIVHRANMEKISQPAFPRRDGDGKVLKRSGWVSPEPRLAKALTSVSSKFDLVPAEEMSTQQASLMMVVNLLAAELSLDLQQMSSALASGDSVGVRWSQVLQNLGIPIIDDFVHISFVDESDFAQLLAQSLASYPALCVGYDRSRLLQINQPSSLDFCLVASIKGSEVVIIDPVTSTLGPRAVNVDHLFVAVKSAQDGLHRFRRV